LRILVTGATGFTGKRVLPLLKGRGEIRVFARTHSDTALAQDLGYTICRGELRDLDSLAAAMDGCEGLINIASLGFGHAQGIVDTAQRMGISRAVFLSTTALFTQLPAPSKKVRGEAEAYVMGSALAWSILRPTMIYGDRDDRNMVRLLKLLKRIPIIPVPGSGQGLMQPIHVEDLAQAIVAAFFCEAAHGKAYNLSGASPLSFDAIIDEAAHALKVRRWKMHLPIGPIRMMVRFYEKLSKRPRIKDEQILRLLEDKAFDHSDARTDFGFQPRTFQTGIGREAELAGLV